VVLKILRVARDLKLVRISPGQGQPTAIEHVSILCVPTNDQANMIDQARKTNWCATAALTTPSATGPNIMRLGPLFFRNPEVMEAMCPEYWGMLVNAELEPQGWYSPRDIYKLAHNFYHKEKEYWYAQNPSFHTAFIQFTKPQTPREFLVLSLVHIKLK